MTTRDPGLPRHEIDKRLVRRSFGRAAEDYERLGQLQRRIADRLLDEVARRGAAGGTIVDAGAGTGYCLRGMARLNPCASLVALDLSERMLHQIQATTGSDSMFRVCGDAECLPLRSASVDIVVSNLVLQWCADLGATFREFARVLVPGGWLFFSTFGEGTLAELRAAWAMVDSHSHVNRFRSDAALRSAVGQAGLDLLALPCRTEVTEYFDVDALMRDLKGWGAHNITAGRPRHLVGKGTMARMISAYQRRHATPGGGISASFAVHLGVARRSP